MVGIDDGHDRLVQGFFGDVSLVDEGHLFAVQALDRAGGLRRAQGAAIAKGGHEVALARLLQLGFVAGNRAEVLGPVQPVLRVGQRVENLDW
jgi:hypothetical protein